MKIAMQSVQALKGELVDIEETEVEVEPVMTYANSLEDIPRNAMKLVRGFIFVTGCSQTVTHVPRRSEYRFLINICKPRRGQTETSGPSRTHWHH
jgi:hypothetical protein